jgi:hypothetical protein
LPHKANIKPALSAGLLLLGCSTAHAHPGWGIVVDSRGQIYFGDVIHNIVWRIDTNDVLDTFVTNVHSHALAVDSNGNVLGEHLRYISSNDTWEASLWSCKPDGKVTTTYGPAPGFPPSLVTDSDENRYSAAGVKDTTSFIVRQRSDGVVDTLAGGEWGQADGRRREAKLSRVGVMTFSADGALYFIDGLAVRKLAPDGTVSTLARDHPLFHTEVLPRLTAGGSHHLMGIATDEHLNVYVANQGNKRVLKISPDGEVTEFFHSSGIWTPTGVTVANGFLYVLEHGFIPPSTNKAPHVWRVGPSAQHQMLGKGSR